MTGKHFIDDPKDLTVNALRGLVRSNPRLTLDAAHKVVFIEPSEQRVHLLSGGGSGHEPASSGFVGDNMLDCAVSGDIFVCVCAS